MKSIQEILESACINGCLEITKICIEEGADIHRKDNFALNLGIDYHHYKVVKYLLENGANPYDYDYRYRDAFDEARLFGTKEIVDLLENYR